MIFNKGKKFSRKYTQGKNKICYVFSAKPREGFCPTSHRYAYNNGKYCCKDNKDGSGNDLRHDSTTCNHGRLTTCATDVCYNNPRGNRVITIYFRPCLPLIFINKMSKVLIHHAKPSLRF